jgi:hypothetical protein
MLLGLHQALVEFMEGPEYKVSKQIGTQMNKKFSCQARQADISGLFQSLSAELRRTADMFLIDFELSGR